MFKRSISRSLSRRSVVITHGILTLIVSSPPSTSRVTFENCQNLVTSDANVARGQSNSVATI